MYFSVVIPTYNRLDMLLRVLDALEKQADAPEFEVIVIDDGSTDDSVDIVREFADRDSTLQLLQNPHNIGLQASIARVLPLVTADYLVWTASDDRLLPAFLEKSMEVLERHPHAGLCFSELSVLRGNSGRVQRLADVPALHGQRSPFLFLCHVKLERMRCGTDHLYGFVRKREVRDNHFCSSLC